MTYQAQRRLYHSRDKTIIERGEPVDVSHLDADALDRLIQGGAIKAITPPTPPQPEKEAE